MSIKKAYDSWSNIYDTNDNKTRDLDRKVTIEILSKYKFESVLELGCGTGKNTQWLLNRAKRIIGLDFSQGMLDKAREKVSSKKVEFKQTDLNQNWNVKNDYADLITCSLTLEHIENLDFIFSQAYQKVKAGGIFFICELHPFKQYTGCKAKYETNNVIKELDVYVHHISEYLKCARKNKFQLIHLNEWFDENDQSNKEIPRLISFVFTKPDIF